MSFERRAEQVFGDALDRSDKERAAFVKEACGGDLSLLNNVLTLLSAHEQAVGFLDGSAVRAFAKVAGAADPTIGKQFGAFRVTGHIATGGMGQVYLGERTEDDFTQRAAIKIIHRGYGEEALRRFRNECQVLAALEHPNIARMIDGGFTATGTPFIIMEYVDGVSLDEYCEEKHLSVVQCLDLFRDVCAALQHAHKHSTIHRDIKPSNILVNRSGTVKLVDFGIARVLDAADGVDRERTATGQQMMTPLYASPEQLRGGVVSTATDIYSMGVVLYKILTGRSPYMAREGSAQEMAHLVESALPAKPSELLLRPDPDNPTIGPSDTRKRSREVRGDLDTIVLMAMRKESERRYSSVEQFSEDILRYLRGRPVIAQPDTFEYRTRKFLRRNAVGAVAATIVIITLIASSVVGFSLYRRAETERRAAEAARDVALQNEETADAVSKFLTNLFDEAGPEKSLGQVLTARDIVDRGAARVHVELGDQPAIRARVLKSIGDVYNMLAEPDSARAMLEESIRIERKIHGDTHQDLASSLRAYGDLLSAIGDHQGALRQHLEALDVMRRLYGTEDRRLPPFMNRIALNNPTMGIDEKIAMFRRSLAIIEGSFGVNDPVVGHYLINLGGALRGAGQYEEAYRVLTRSLDIREAALGADHPLVAQSMSSIASTLNAMGRYAEAVPLQEQALAIREKVYGAEHLYVTMSLYSLATSYAGLERFAEARPLYSRAIAIKESLYGKMHPFIGLDEARLAISYIRDQQPENALPHLERSLDILRASYGENDPQLGHPLTGLGEAQAAMGNHDAALEYFERALELRAGLAKDHPLFGETLQLYAKSLREVGRRKDADNASAQAQWILRQP